MSATISLRDFVNSSSNSNEDELESFYNSHQATQMSHEYGIQHLGESLGHLANSFSTPANQVIAINKELLEEVVCHLKQLHNFYRRNFISRHKATYLKELLESLENLLR